MWGGFVKEGSGAIRPVREGCPKWAKMHVLSMDAWSPPWVLLPAPPGLLCLSPPSSISPSPTAGWVPLGKHGCQVIF